MSMFWAFDGVSRNQRRAHDAAMDAKEQSTQAMGQLAQLEHRCERLATVNEALWLLLKERLGLTEVELEAKVRDLDLAGGGHAALLDRTLVTCPSCQRQVNTKHKQCMYCGAALSGLAPA